MRVQARALIGPVTDPAIQALQTFYKALADAKKCTNCGNADDLFPHHTWRNCPFYTPPHRASLWPAHQSPIKSIAAGGVPSKPPPDPPGSALKTLIGCPAQFLTPTELKEPPQYKGTVTSLSTGTSGADNGYIHVFPVQFQSPPSTNK